MWVETLRRGSLTVFIASTLRSCRIRLDRATSRRGTRTLPAARSFANGPAAIVRVENAVFSDGQMKGMGVLTAGEGDWTLQAVTDHLRELTGGKDAVAALGAPYGAVGSPVDTQVGVTTGFEIEVRTPIMFTVSLKVAGVEKARVTARSGPGAERV